ncbi:MAG: hypothetical protein ACYC0T_20930 [Ramlibacter sp.]
MLLRLQPDAVPGASQRPLPHRPSRFLPRSPAAGLWLLRLFGIGATATAELNGATTECAGANAKAAEAYPGGFADGEQERFSSGAALTRLHIACGDMSLR